MSQFALSMHLPATYATAQFIVSPSNELAYNAIIRWPEWPHHALYLQGEYGAGKTHLAHIWQQKSNAVFLSPDAAEMPTQPIIIDDVESWKDTTRLFHVLNHCMLQSQPLLIIAQSAPDKLPITLPDVLSRLKLMPQIAIEPPDDVLMEAVLYKQLSDRQLKITPDVIAYLMPRLSRSFSAITEVVAQLDNASLSAQRMLTIPFIRQTMGW